MSPFKFHVKTLPSESIPSPPFLNSIHPRSSSTSVSVTSEGDLVCLTWSDQRDGNWEIYYKYSVNGGASFSSDQRLTNANGNSWYPSIAADDSFIHICWQDARDGNNEIYYKLSTDGGMTWHTDTGTLTIVSQSDTQVEIDFTYTGVPAQGGGAAGTFDLAGHLTADLTQL